MTYKPSPIDTSNISLSEDLLGLTELLATNAHDLWAAQRISEGWRFGPKRDDQKKEHPDLVPYQQLPESEKAYDRIAAMETLRAIIALDFRIEKAQKRE